MAERLIQFEKMPDGTFCLWDNAGTFLEGINGLEVRAYTNRVIEEVGYVNCVPGENLSQYKGADSSATS